MGILISCIYVVIGVITFIVTLKIHAKERDIYRDDVYMHFVLFGVIWWIGLCILAFEYTIDLLGSIGDKLANWANK